jgi:site-specific DNA-methyltransferase (adenine-specific)
LDIDGSRVDFVSEEDRKESTTKNQHADFGTKPMTNNNVYGDYSMIEPKNFNPTGRFPANLIHDGSEEVLELFPITKTGSIKPYKHNNSSTIYGGGKGIQLGNITGHHTGDSGSAARFFYCAKASKSERNRGCEDTKNSHPTIKPIALMEYLVKLVSREGALVLDPFGGSGSTGMACKSLGRNYILIEKDEEYCKIAEERLK